MRPALAMLLVLTASAFAQEAKPSPESQQPPANQQPVPTQPPPRDPRSQPMAKSEAEYNDFIAVRNQADLNAAAVAADEFDKKYPESELRVPLRSVLMQRSTLANKPDETLAQAARILAIEPEHTLALVISATTYAERTRQTDLDRDERYARAISNAQKALSSLDTGFAVPANTPPETIAAGKRTITAMAYSAMGFVELHRKNYAAAEKHLQAAVSAKPEQHDPATLYRLTLAQHGQKKVKEALATVDTAITAAQAAKDAVTLKLAEEEKAQLVKLQAPPKQ